MRLALASIEDRRLQGRLTVLERQHPASLCKRCYDLVPAAAGTAMNRELEDTRNVENTGLRLIREVPGNEFRAKQHDSSGPPPRLESDARDPSKPPESERAECRQGHVVSHTLHVVRPAEGTLVRALHRRKSGRA